MSSVRSFFGRTSLFLSNLFSKKKIVVANNEAIKAMKELDESIINHKFLEINGQLSELAKELKIITELNKVNQEFLLYACTNGEELLNIVSGGEIVNGDPAADEDDPEKDLIDAQWNPVKKGNNTLN